MNFRFGKLCGIFCVAVVMSVALSLNIFGETFNSNVFTTEPKNNFDGFSGKSLDTTANLNWSTANGGKITRTTVKNLPSYLLTTNADKEGNTTFVSSPKNPLDISRVGRLSFVMQYDADEKVEYTVKLTLDDGMDRLVCTASLKGNYRQLVSFEMGFFSPERKITEMSLEFSSETDGGKISISGPYYTEIDETYSDEFSLGDIELSSDATYVREGIFVADSTQKTGFSGRFLNSKKIDANHLRLFATTGEYGGTLEIRYSYFNESNGNLATKSVNVSLESKSQNASYIIPLEYSDKIVSLTFLFDVSRSGGVTVHKIEAVEIYQPPAQIRHGEISQCLYNAKAGTITVKGKIFHDFLIKHTSYTLYLYRLDKSETLQSIMDSGKKPVASAKMSSEFKMTYNAGRQDKLAAISLYTVVAFDGEKFIEILPSFHVENKSASAVSDASLIKGIVGENISCFSNMGAGVSCVDVYLDRLFCEKKSGYIYSLGNSHVYFDSDYIHTIDKQVKNLCVAGCSVYLRLLIGENGADLPFATATAEDQGYSFEIKNQDARTNLFAAIDFLTSRYSDHQNGRVAGYIVGRSENYEGTSDVDIDRITAEILETVALSAAVAMVDAKVILPISADVDSEIFLRSLYNRLQERGGLRFFLMLESRQTCFSLGHVEEFNACFVSIERTLERISTLYKWAQSKYFYTWMPDPAESAESMKISYAYMYMRFLASNNCESFILSTNKTQDSELLDFVKFFDTSKNTELSDSVLKLLGVEKWEDIIEGFSNTRVPVRDYTETANKEISSMGTFDLFNFSSSFSSLGWFDADGCISLSMSMSAGEKHLHALMENYDGHSELAYHFDYPEKLSMAPCLSFDFSVGEVDTEKYSVKIIVRSGNDVLEAVDVFSGGEQKRFTVDISSVADAVDSLSICVNAVEGVRDNFDFKLSRISVLSKNMTDKQLLDSIEQARAQAGHHVNGSLDIERESPDYEFVIVLVGILAICVIVAGIYDRSKEK